jgi:GNAT superfamily N-acetyltransferase
MTILSSRWSIHQLNKSHDRSSFDCGSAALNTFLRQFARQNARDGLSRTYVACRPESVSVSGFYTLASAQVDHAELAAAEKRGLPKYPVPAILIARLAVDKTLHGAGLGRALLRDAFVRILGVAKDIGVRLVAVDAKDGAAQAFYERIGFALLEGSGRRLFLPVATLRTTMLSAANERAKKW